MQSINNAPIRSFIAVNLSPDVLTSLEKISRILEQALQKRLKQSSKYSVVRWIPARNIHLTLKFLGDVPAGKVSIIQQTLQSCLLDFTGFDIAVGGLGAFPKIKQPSIIWIGTETPETLKSIAQRIEDRMEEHGFEKEERPFKAHLSLGRVAKNVDVAAMRALADVLNEFQENTPGLRNLGNCRIDAVHFYRSDLRPEGAVYNCLFSIPLMDK
jgi:2'-5' RNA ligase